MNNASHRGLALAFAVVVLAVSVAAEGSPVASPAPPVIESTAVEPAATEATVLISLAQPGPLRTEYREQGADAWTPGPNETSYDYADHVQGLSDLAPGTAYEVRAIAYDGPRETVSDPVPFTTLDASPSPSALPSDEPTETASPAIEPEPAPTTMAPDATPPASWLDNPVGPGIYAATGKSNRQLREGAHAIVFDADTSSRVLYVRLPWTNREDPYGGGDGGTFRFGFQRVNGRGFPNGSWVGQTVTKDVPIQSGAFIEEIDFSDGPELRRGRTYAFVMENVSSSPDSNWGSPNMLFAPGAGTQPRDSDHVWLDGSFYTDPYEWEPPRATTPTWDLAYADGVHEGFSGLRGANDDACSVSSVCRWVFDYGGAERTVSEVCAAWVGGSGTTAVTVSVNGSTVATASLGDGDPWACGELSANVDLEAGDDVVVTFSGSDRELGLVLTRDGSDGQPMGSFPYTEPHHWAYVGESGTTGAWNDWKEDTVYQVYLS